MSPAPSGLQEVDGLNHLLGNPRPDRILFGNILGNYLIGDIARTATEVCPHISRIKSRTRLATSAPSAGRRYFVIDTRWRRISKTVCAPCR
jgi:hypothetical protein